MVSRRRRLVKSSLSATALRILLLLEDAHSATRTELAAELGVSYRTIRRAVCELRTFDGVEVTPRAIRLEVLEDPRSETAGHELDRVGEALDVAGLRTAARSWVRVWSHDHADQLAEVASAAFEDVVEAARRVAERAALKARHKQPYPPHWALEDLISAIVQVEAARLVAPAVSPPAKKPAKPKPPTPAPVNVSTSAEVAAAWSRVLESVSERLPAGVVERWLMPLAVGGDFEEGITLYAGDDADFVQIYESVLKVHWHHVMDSEIPLRIAGFPAA